MVVEDIASQSSVVFETWYDWKDTISWVHVSPGSAPSLVRRGGITNYLSIAHYFVNISAKNYRNWLIYVKVIVCYISVIFETQCSAFALPGEMLKCKNHFFSHGLYYCIARLQPAAGWIYWVSFLTMHANAAVWLLKLSFGPYSAIAEEK